MAISKIITIILIPFTKLGKIIFNMNTSKMLIKSLKNISTSTGIFYSKPIATPSLLKSDTPIQLFFSRHIMFKPLFISFFLTL